MISNHLSMVEALRPASNELAHNIEAFLSKGGTIQVLEGPNFRPPPARHEPPPRKKANKPSPRRQAEPEELPVEPLDPARDKRMKLLERVLAIADTHTQTEASMALGVGSRTLSRLSKEFDFKFRRSSHGGYNGAERQQALNGRDERFVERIKAFKELGISRRQVCGKLAISCKTLDRILIKFGIDYPKLAKGPAPAFFAKPAQQA